MSSAVLKFTSVPVTSKYGPRPRFSVPHKGADTANGSKYPHSVFGDGVVTFAGRHARRPWPLKQHPDYERGIHVIVNHAPGIDTSYHSLSRVNVKKGQRVKMGDIVGWAGTSAVGANGDHVHNGLWFNGQHVDPLKYLKPGVAVTVTNPYAMSPAPGNSAGGKPVPVAVPDAPTPAPEPKELDMSTIRYVHRVEKGYGPEWMIVGMEIPGGFQTTTDQTTAEGWGVIYGTDKGDSWRGLTRKQYIALQASAASLNAAYVVQQKAIRA